MIYIYNIDSRPEKQSANPNILMFPKPRTGIFQLVSSFVRDNWDITPNYFFFDKLYTDWNRNHVLRIVSAVLYAEQLTYYSKSTSKY